MPVLSLKLRDIMEKNELKRFWNCVGNLRSKKEVTICTVKNKVPEPISTESPASKPNPEVFGVNRTYQAYRLYHTLGNRKPPINYKILILLISSINEGYIIL